MPLTDGERAKLRKAKDKISEIHTFEEENITELLGVSIERAKILKGLADFQNVPSIGSKLAEKLVFELSIFS
ncbi:hypothetical protein [Ornithinibacillus halotolerans]|uniref:hypothetical protein n=1 Tax=Ornithinibacillus halotolerans TaxID=1274357 RepID=UPI0016679B53|nr:hypothetical protein [Ornithinibacillus halotolerans]